MEELLIWGLHCPFHSQGTQALSETVHRVIIRKQLNYTHDVSYVPLTEGITLGTENRRSFMDNILKILYPAVKDWTKRMASTNHLT